MEPQTLPSTPASKAQETVSELIPSSRDVPWTLASVPAREVEVETSHWHLEQSKGTIHLVGRYNDDVYEVIIDPIHLSRLVDWNLNLDYKPTQAGEIRTAIYGTQRATKDARASWLRHAAHKIRSENHPEVEPAYCHFARMNSLQEALNREKLSYDILTSTASVRRKLAHVLVILVLSFVRHGDSFVTDHFLQSNEDDILESFQLSLPIPQPPERTRRDEAQLTSLIRALLELSDGTVDHHQHGFAPEYTIEKNADLYASILGITRARAFGDSNPEEICNALSKYPVFSEMPADVPKLEDLRLKMMNFLHIGFPEEHLNLPSSVLRGFGIGYLDCFHAYLEHTYLTFPSLRKPENNMLLFIAWSTTLSTSSMDYRRELTALSRWADSEGGHNLYKQLAIDVQKPQSVVQLVLDIAALMAYRRLCPDLNDDRDQPITGSYLGDLNALLHGHALGNSGKVAEQMVFALLRVLCCMNQYDDLAVFLEAVLGRAPPPLHLLDGLADQYLRHRTHGQTHETSFETTMEAMSHLGMQEPDWVYIHDDSPKPSNDCTVPAAETWVPVKQCQPEVPRTIEPSTAIATAQADTKPSYTAAVSSPSYEMILPFPPDLCADDYTLIRLSNVDHQHRLDKTIGGVQEVPDINELSDRSWAICVLRSYLLTARGILEKLYPDSEIDIDYNPFEPLAKDVELWGYKKAEELHRQWLFSRAMNIIMNGWDPAAWFYSNILRTMCGLDKTAAGSVKSYSFAQPLVPTYRGFIRNKDDAVYLLEGCLLGEFSHSCRGPRDGEATTSGNIFVWEENSAYIDDWKDGMNWVVQKQPDCEFSEARNGSGLMKKTFSIPFGGAVHHVISYYAPWDATTLALPPRRIAIRAELACVLTTR